MFKITDGFTPIKGHFILQKHKIVLHSQLYLFDVPPYVPFTAVRILCAYFETVQFTVPLTLHSYVHSTLIVQYN